MNRCHLFIPILSLYTLLIPITEPQATSRGLNHRTVKVLSENWCGTDYLEVDTIDDVYDCFRESRGDQEFEVQIKCENEVFPLTMSKNEVRKELCHNKKSKRFQECFEKEIQEAAQGLEVMGRRRIARKRMSSVDEMEKKKLLVECMKDVLDTDSED